MLHVSSPIKRFSGCKKLCIQKNLQTVLSYIYIHVVCVCVYTQHEVSFLGAESCVCGCGYVRKNSVWRLFLGVLPYLSDYFRIGTIFFCQIPFMII
jgi:hypothetical protein